MSRIIIVCLGVSLCIFQVFAVSLKEYIQQHGVPVPVEGTLDLSECQLTNLEGAQDLPQPETITHLYFANNILETLPEGIFDRFVNLQSLALTDNALCTVPAYSFDKLTKLTRLELDGNNLRTLPVGIFDFLSALSTLDLSRNKLRYLPAGIFAKTLKLRSIELYQNKLAILEFDIFARLKRLRLITLARNRIPGTEQAFKNRYLPHVQLDDLIYFEKSLFDRVLEHKQRTLGAALESGIPDKNYVKYMLTQLCSVPEQYLCSRIYLRDNLGNTLLHKIISNYTHKRGAEILALIREIVRIWPSMLKVKNNFGSTPLHIAAGLTTTENVYRLFCELLALSNHKNKLLIYKDNKGDTPLQVALYNNHKVIVRVLQRAHVF